MDQSNLLDALLAPQLNCLFQQPQRLGKPSGWWGHVPFAYWVVAAARPRMLVELGTHHGVSYAAFCEAVRLAGLDCRCFAVDHWQGDIHTGHIDEAVYRDMAEFNQTRYGAFSELIRTNFAAALPHFADGSIDLLHIDGFHTYDAVRRDYEQWRPKLSERAVVLLHDTNVRRDDFGVHRLFGELARDYPHFEFLHGHGLGLIALGEHAPQAIRQLCADTGEAAALRERFAWLGARWESHASEQAAAHSFALQVAALEAERVKAGDQRARAEAERDTAEQRLARADTALAGEQARTADLERTLDTELEQAAERIAQRERVHAGELAQVRRYHDEALDQRDDARRENDRLRGELQTLAAQSRDRMAALEAALAAAETRAGEARAELTRNQAAAQIQAQRLAQGLLAHQRPVASAGPRHHLRRMRLWLRHGYAKRNPVADVIRRSPLFDARWYLDTYPDVAHARIEPAFHYAAHGGAEGRDPGPWFSTSDYLRHNPDAANAGHNALFHYELHGRAEGRGFPLKPLLAGAAAPTPDIDPKATFRRHSRELLQAFMAQGDPLRLPTAEQPEVSIVLVLHNQAELTFRCLQSLAATIDVPAEVIVVDNASTDDTAKLLARVQGCRLLPQQENLHFLRAANLGAAQARGRYLLFLNNDTLVKPGAISAAAAVFAERANIGAVGGKIVLLDGTLQEAGSIIWRDGSCLGYGRGRDPGDPEFQFRREVDFCSGAFLMVPRALFEQLEGFSTAFAPAYYEETDLCLRLRQAGHATVYEPRAEIVHVEYGSASHDKAAWQLMQERQATLVARHAAVLNQDHLPAGASALLARMPRGARILLIDDQVPVASWGSGYPRARELVLALHRRGAFITQLPTATVTVDLDDAYASLPREIEIAAGHGRAGMAAFLRSRRDYYDAVIISRPHNMAALLDALEREPDLLGRTRLVYDAEAIFAQRERLKADVLGQILPAETTTLDAELQLAQAARTILAVSRAEADRFSQAGHGDVRVLSHSIDLRPTDTGYGERRDLLFVGRLEEEDSPNADSVRWFVQDVMPRLDRLLGDGYRLHIVGACSQTLRRQLENPRVRFHGRVADIHDFYARSRLFIAPTRFSAGVPLKVYEAAGHGLPVVASRLLVEQLDWTDGSELLGADSPDAFARACASLYTEQPRWENIRRQALQRVSQDCSPQRFAETVGQLLNETSLH